MELSLQEKAALVAGTGFMDTNALPRIGLPALHMADGPHGLRRQAEGEGGYTGSAPATAFPTASALAAGWDPALVRAAGEVIARECRQAGVGLLLGPAVNIRRDPRCGRDFEYYSEDPLLSGELGAAFVAGVQSQGVGACVKHFALNNSENYRFVGDSVADERTVRELYLRPFERIVKAASPAAVMCAYNKVNGVYCSENAFLLTKILRGEWGFGGAVLSDWGAVRDRPASLCAGTDLEMPGDTAVCRRAVLDGGASPALDAACARVADLVRRYARPQPCAADFAAHDALAADIAADCAVLLKNDGMLPLCGKKLAVVGERFERPRIQGGGSSHVRPARLCSPKDALDGRGVAYSYARGYRIGARETDGALLAEAVRAAQEAEVVLLFLGTDDFSESEACDRESLRLPACQCELLKAVVAAGRPVAAVLTCGGAVELPFFEDLSALLYLGLAGQGTGEAAVRLLLGERSPCGRLPATWPLCAADLPAGASFGRSPRELYKEGVFVGYRYFASARRAVRFPFGFGLSYTSFSRELRSLTVRDGQVRALCAVTNTGSVDGADVLQLYVRAPRTKFCKPVRELRAFAKVYVPAGQTAEAELCFPLSDLRVFDPARGAWALEKGEYEAQLCSDAHTVLCRARFFAEGESLAPCAAPFAQQDDAFARACGAAPLPPRRPVTMETRLGDLGVTLWGRLLRRVLLRAACRVPRAQKKQMTAAERADRAANAAFMRRAAENISLRGMSMCAGARCPYNVARGLMHLCNGHVLRALRCFFRRIRVPALPADEADAPRGEEPQGGRPHGDA